MSILKIRDADGNVQEVLCIKGDPGKDGENGQPGNDGYTPQKGIDYFDGVDGYTPVKGTDYWTEADKAKMVEDVIAALPVYNGEVV